VDKVKQNSFFKQILISIKDFEKYQDFALERMSNSIKYLLKLMLIFGVIVSIAFLYKFINITNKGIEYFKNDIKNLSFESSVLDIEQDEPILLQDVNEFPGIVIIDTKADIADTNKIEEYSKKIGLYDNGILVLKDRLIIKNVTTTTQSTILFENLVEKYGIQDFTKQDIVDNISFNNLLKVHVFSFIIILIYVFIIYLASVFVDTIVLSVIGILTSKIALLKIRFGNLFNLAVHSLTLPILLNMTYLVVNVLIGFEIKYFNIMYTSVSYIYMVTAILVIRADLTKRQAELMKIVEEQEKIKAEIEEQKEKDNEEEKKNNKDNKGNNKDSQKEDDNGEKKEKPKKKKEEKDNDTNIGKEAKGEI